MTNFDKLARWDADFYKSLTDDDCIVCLTERQVYLIGQIIDQLKWYRTRWVGDTTDLDFDAIAGDLHYRINERMTCQNLTDITTIIQNLQEKIITLEQTINATFNTVDDGTDIYIWNSSTSTVTDNYSPSELADIGVETETCTSTDKDAIYGACNALVRFINTTNIDFLERINQAGNLPDQIARVISAIPGLGQLPVDEAFSWGQFIATELEDEYNATVDEALLQMVVCDLFCIAVNSNCHLDFNDVFNYFSGKVSPTLSHATTTFLNLVNFGLTGTFAGDDYFFYFCYFQIVTVGMGQFFFGLNSLNDYAYQTRAGLNSPDNDWSIFCLSCPTQYRLWTHDFASGLGDFTIGTGIQDGARIKGVDIGTSKAIAVTMPHTSTWRVKGAKLYLERIAGIANGSQDTTLINWRATPGTNVGNIAQFPGGGFQPNGILQTCEMYVIAPQYISGCNEIYIELRVNDNASSNIYFDKIEVLYEAAYAPVGAIITEDNNICA